MPHTSFTGWTSSVTVPGWGARLSRAGRRVKRPYVTATRSSLPRDRGAGKGFRRPSAHRRSAASCAAGPARSQRRAVAALVGQEALELRAELVGGRDLGGLREQAGPPDRRGRSCRTAPRARARRRRPPPTPCTCRSISSLASCTAAVSARDPQVEPGRALDVAQRRLAGLRERRLREVVRDVHGEAHGVVAGLRRAGTRAARSRWPGPARCRTTTCGRRRARAGWRARSPTAAACAGRPWGCRGRRRSAARRSARRAAGRRPRTAPTARPARRRA